jgi:type VI protein secretion system component VasK
MGTKRLSTTVFVVLVVVLVAATGVFVSLYLVERAGVKDVGEQSASVERQVSEARAEVRDNRAAAEDLVDARTELQAENDRLHACADPTEDSIAAVRAGDDAALDAAIDQMFLHCGR